MSKLFTPILILFLIGESCNTRNIKPISSSMCRTSISDYGKFDSIAFNSIIDIKLFLSFSEIIPLKTTLVNLDSSNSYITYYNKKTEFLIFKKGGKLSFAGQSGTWTTNPTGIFVKLNTSECYKEIFNGDFAFFTLNNDKYLFQHNIYIDTINYRCKFIFSPIN